MINHTIELIPFNVPERVFIKMPSGKREEGFAKSAGIPLTELSHETLEQLCAAFRMSVFVSAKKQPLLTRDDGPAGVLGSF